MKRKKRRWGILARGAVTAFSVFVALDTFIIPASYSAVKAGDSTLFSELESRAAAEDTDATAAESTAVTGAEGTNVTSADSETVTTDTVTAAESTAEAGAEGTSVTTADSGAAAAAESTAEAGAEGMSVKSADSDAAAGETATSGTLSGTTLFPWQDRANVLRFSVRSPYVTMSGE